MFFFVGQRSNKNNGINFNRNQQVGDLLPRARPDSILILSKICKVNRTIKFHINNLSIVLHSLNHSKCYVIRLGTKVLVTDLLTLCVRSVVLLGILPCIIGTGLITLISPKISLMHWRLSLSLIRRIPTGIPILVRLLI